MKNEIFLTFDFDWAPDFVIEDLLNILVKKKVKATFFITNYSNLLNTIRNYSLFDLGIHPNFNDILYAKTTDTFENRIDNLLKIIPEAVSIRSHSLTFSSIIENYYIKKGIRFSLNKYIPFDSGIKLKPYRTWTGIIEVPFFWEDDIYCKMLENHYSHNINHIFKNDGLKVFNFHPIHVYLNTEKIERYSQAKIYMKDEKKLKKFINDYNSFGIRNILLNVINFASDNNYEFKLIKNIKVGENL